MGINMSTLGGWAFLTVLGAAIYWNSRTRQPAHLATKAKKKLEHTPPARKEPKEKAKRQRTEAFANESKSAQPKPKAVETFSAPSRAADYSSDDVDNKEFARQLASVKQGTSLNASKKDEKRQKSVKQSRAQVIDQPAANGNKKAAAQKASAPSSTAGADGDDDESPIASPEVVAADAGDVSDMLEPKSAGPAVLRLTDTDKTKKKEKKAAKAPEPVETKKQRQNRQKAEAAKAAREEAEKDRQVALENQRRLARISEGRAAKDGSAFMAAQSVQSVWKDDGANTKLSSNNTNGATVDEPLSTFSTKATAPVKAAPPAKATAPIPAKSENWMSSLPSEEEQLERLRQDDSWSTVTKKAKTKKVHSTESESEATDSAPKVVSQPPVAPALKATAANGNVTTKPVRQGIQQQSSFAALSVDDEEEVEKEWDV